MSQGEVLYLPDIGRDMPILESLPSLCRRVARRHRFAEAQLRLWIKSKESTADLRHTGFHESVALSSCLGSPVHVQGWFIQR